MGRRENNSSENKSEHQKLVDSVILRIKELENPKVTEQCIYRAPEKVRRINEVAYTPHVISIGPFHHKDKKLQSMKSMQQLKLIYLKCFLDGTGLKLEDCIGKLKEHFTDLLRIFYLSPNKRFQKRSEGTILEHLYSASELVEAGVEFKVHKTEKCLLEFEYDKGMLTMPKLDVSDRTEFHLRNIVAFEQAHFPAQTYITDYLKVLDFLVNSERDVDILIHKRIITTLLGDSNEVATMINRLCSNLIQPNMNNEYLSICEQLNEFYEKPMNKLKAGVKQLPLLQLY
ncbi:hypothetical protein L6164_013100 [Bauhinia variegata]|uniref:Uncharacterized protein n=1 Tax=Bauhinia variegata TaxID=167791 RepID=A0ACB9PB39_BAUVA|nr:hypothetical protein L6164_013100 [Bauhinia variegata]